MKGAVLRIRDVYPGSRILIFTHPGSRIPDLGSRIQKQQQKREVKKISCQTFLCSHKFNKIVNYFSFEVLKKKICANFSKNYRTFYQNNCQKALQNMVLGSGIRDPGSGKNPFRIPDPGVKKAPDPGSGSATLEGSGRLNSEQWFKMADNERATRRTDPMNIRIQAARLETRRNFFSNRMPEAWNSVPRDIRQARTAQAFKKAYKEHRRHMASIS
jgi:hypothetical protein